MLGELRSRRADGLIIHKIDRSARNLRDWADLGDLIDRGIDVRFVSDNFDLLSRGGRLSADIQAVVAADYIRNLRDEVKKGMYGRLKQGLYPWRAPLGYLDNGKAKPKTIDPIKGPLVRELFERYGTNTIGFEDLRVEMQTKGLVSAVGKPLSNNALTVILNNPFYAGVARIGTTGETFTGIHEPLISKTLFERVQRILRAKTAPRSKKHQFLLSRIVKCGECRQRTLIGEYQKSKIYYRCHGRGCRGVSWRGDVLEAVVMREFSRIRFSFGGRGDEGTDIAYDMRDEFDDLKKMLEDECHQHESEREQRHNALKLKLANIDARSERLTDLLIDGTIGQADYNSRKERLLLDRQSVATDLKADPLAPFAALLQELQRNDRDLLRYEELTRDERRELIEIVSSNFTVSGKNPVFVLRSPYREIAEARERLECEHSRDCDRTFRLFEMLKSYSEQHPGAADEIRLLSRMSEMH
jgi:hypothetical protein